MTTADLSRLGNPLDGELIQLDAGTYTVTPPMPTTDPAPVLWSWKDKVGVRVRGFSSRMTIIEAGNPGGLFELRDCHDITFEDISFVGSGMNVASPSPAYYSAVTLEGCCGNVRFERCEFIGWGDQAIGHLHNGWDEDCLVTDCYFENIGCLCHPTLTGDGAGVAWHGQRNHVLRSTFRNCLRGVEIEDKYGNSDCCGNTVQGCTFIDTIWHGVIICPTHGFQEKFHDNRILNNTFLHPSPALGKWADRGIYVQGGNNLLIANNQIETDTLCPVVVETICGVNGLTITGNQLRSHKSDGINVNATRPFPVKNLSITNNVIGPCGGRGMALKGDGVTVIGNTIGERGRQPNGKPWEACYVDPSSIHVSVSNNHDRLC